MSCLKNFIAQFCFNCKDAQKRVADLISDREFYVKLLKDSNERVRRPLVPKRDGGRYRKQGVSKTSYHSPTKSQARILPPGI